MLGLDFSDVSEYRTRENIIDDLRKSGLPVMVHGSGRFAAATAKYVIGAGLEFSGFIDREEYYYEGKTINLNGISYICTTKQDIVRSGNRFNLLAGVIDYSELEESRKEFRDCCEYIEYLDVYDSHMMEYKFLKNHAAELMEIYDTLCDDESKDVLEAYLHARYTGDVRSIVNRKHTGMLYDWKLLGISDEDVLIDAGAYVGDSILEIKNEYGFIPKNVFALEPDRKNAVKLLDNFTPEEMVRIHPILAGLHERDGIMKFTDVGTVGSCLADDGSVSVKVHSLDEHQAYSAATVIKMDIEGSEPYAIRGGWRLIRDKHPRLAVCVYHNNEDLLTLYKLLKGENYKMYLRQHSNSVEETVLYAI